MPHDKRGEELKVGDTVMVPCVIKAIHLTEDYCNVDLETKLAMPPLDRVSALTLNSRQIIKPTATYRFADYPELAAEPAQGSRDGWQPIEIPGRQSLVRDLRRIAKGTRLTSLDTSAIEDAADILERLGKPAAPGSDKS